MFISKNMDYQNLSAEQFKRRFGGEHLTYAMSINTYSSQKLENLQLDHKEK